MPHADPSRDRGDAEARRVEAELRARVRDLCSPASEQIKRLLSGLAAHRARLERQNGELLRTRDELEAVRDRYADLYEYAPVGYVSIDSAGIVREANLTAAEMLHIPRDSLMGADFVDFVERGHKEQYLGHLQRCRGGAQQASSELLLTPRGTSFLAVQAQSILHRDSRFGILCRVALTDISELKRVEEQCRTAKEAAERANAAKSSFLANISHEVRTPMTAILGMIDLAIDAQQIQEAHEHLAIAKESAESLLTLLNEILDYSRIEADRFVLEPRPFALRSTVEAALKAIAVSAARKDLSLTRQIAPDVPAVVVGDAQRLRQILVNLLANGIKFTDHGGVELRLAVETQEKDSVWLRFEVKDTGIGIAPELQERIFAPFVQAELSTTRLYGGSGLGLAITSSLVKMMHGRIWVESGLGKGSAFCFSIPFRVASEPLSLGHSAGDEGKRAEALPVLRRPLRILLAEDVPANQKLVTTILQKRGHEVVVAENGRRALERFREQDFDVVLMDVQMPVMDGFAATRALRALAQSRSAHLPIVAMTAHAMRGDEERCLAAGMDAYLAKPVDRRLLIQIVERLAEKSS